jgi:hypothetical protein
LAPANGSDHAPAKVIEERSSSDFEDQYEKFMPTPETNRRVALIFAGLVSGIRDVREQFDG